MSSAEASSVTEGIGNLMQIPYADVPNISMIPHPWAYLDLYSPDGGLLRSRLQMHRNALHDATAMHRELCRLGLITEGEIVVDYRDSFHVQVCSVYLDEDREIFTPIFTLAPAL